MRKYSKQLLVAVIIIIALVAVRLYQAPVRSGAVLNAFVSSSEATVGKPASGALKLIFFNVGQGDSELIITPDGEDILIDGGPDNFVVQKLGQYLPYSDRTIEYVILTHPHADHVAGLVEVLKRYEVGEVITTGASHTLPDYLEFERLIAEKKIKNVVIEQPQTINLGGVSFNFLEPKKSLVGVKLDNLNNSSIVFRLTYVSSSALFTGDFENEEELVASSTLLKSDVLKVGHHGSTNANSRLFLEAVRPQYAVIEVGSGNTYGLPNFRTIYYLEQKGAQVFRTDEDSDVKLESNGQKFLLYK